MLQFLASPFSHASLADAAVRHSTLVPPPDDPALHGLLTAFAATSGWPAMRLLQADADGKLLTLCRVGADAGVPDAWTQAEARAWVDGQPVDLDDPGDGAAGESTPAGGGRRWRVAALRPLHFEGAVVGLLVGYHARHARLDDEHSAALAPLRAALAELLGRRLQSRRARDHDDRLRDFTRASCDWMWELDAGLRYRFLSDGFEAHTGLPCATVVGRPLADVPLLDEVGRPLPDGLTLAQLFGRGVAFTRALSRQRLGDSLRYLSRSAVPVLDAEGRVQGWRGTTRDLTERMEIGALAAEREQRLGKLSGQVPGLIFQYRLDANGLSSVPYVSDRVHELLGVAPPPPDRQATRDALPWHLLHADDREGFAQDLALSARRLAPLVREYRIHRGDGQLRWLETRATPERQADGAVLWHGFATDITDRKEIELQLRRSEQQWELAAAANGTGLLSFALEQGLVEVDPRACAQHGLPAGTPSLSHEEWFALVDEADRDELRAGLQRALAQHAVLERRFGLRWPDGQLRLLEVVARGSYGADDMPVAVVATCRDVTEQAESERLRRDKETAERANRAKTEFLSRVSHELRTPLNGILGFTQLMALDALHRLAPAQRQRRDRVQAASQHLLSLIEDMLELTRIEHGSSGLEVGPVDLTRALSRSLALIEPLAAQHGIGLPGTPTRSCWVEADARALEQVLMNLLSNAIKYNRRQGCVGLSLDLQGDRAVLEVSDEGEGLTPVQQAGLFQPFNRLGAEARRIEGSGLGLVIARELSRAMKGELRLARSGPQGTSFRLELPLTDSVPLALPEPEPVAPSLPETGPRSLLYIEDEPLNVVLMEELVRSRPQWSLRVAYDGASGLALAGSMFPDLVLVDMNLPDTHGLSLIRRLRDLPGGASLRCIALSADAMHEQIERALAAGFDDYWTKPIDVTQMLAQLTRVLAS